MFTRAHIWTDCPANLLKTGQTPPASQPFLTRSALVVTGLFRYFSLSSTVTAEAKKSKSFAISPDLFVATERRLFASLRLKCYLVLYQPIQSCSYDAHADYEAVYPVWREIKKRSLDF